MNTRNTRPQIADFHFKSQQQLRFSDTDAVGHVNNAVFATLFEAGRVDVLFGADHPKLDKNTQFVIARIAIDYLGELNWPGDVTIGSNVSRVGNSSFDLSQAMFVAQKCVAICHSVIVVMDASTRKSTPLIGPVKQFYLEQMDAQQASI